MGEIILSEEDMAIDDSLGSARISFPVFPGTYKMGPQGTLHVLNMSGQLTATSLFGCFKKKETGEKSFIEKTKDRLAKAKADAERAMRKKQGTETISDKIHDAKEQMEKVAEKLTQKTDSVDEAKKD